jgi:hypothetical protein
VIHSVVPEQSADVAGPWIDEEDVAVTCRYGYRIPMIAATRGAGDGAIQQWKAAPGEERREAV